MKHTASGNATDSHRFPFSFCPSAKTIDGANIGSVILFYDINLFFIKITAMHSVEIAPTKHNFLLSLYTCIHKY